MSAIRTSSFRLPPRYADDWGAEFWKFADDALRPGVTVLDIGAGRQPTIVPERRPSGVHYVGLDISGHELAQAEPGSYDETIVADAQEMAPSLFDRFDLIV